MQSQSPKYSSSTKDSKIELNKNFKHISFLKNTLKIAKLQQIQNNIPKEQYFYEYLEIEKQGYVFKRDEGSTDGPEYDKVCPLCGELVTEGYYLVHSSKKLKRKFISHYQCLIYRDSRPFKFVEIPEEINQAILRSDSLQPTKKEESSRIRNYYATLTISHPISDLIFLKLDKKINDWNGQQLEWVFGNRDAMLFSPNTICMPFQDFKCNISIDYKKLVKNYEFFVNLNRRESKKKSYVQVSTSNITLDLDYFTTAEDKEIIIKQMNFIYPFMKTLPVIKLNQIKIKIPEQLNQIDCPSLKKLNTDTVSFSSPTIKSLNQWTQMPISVPVSLPNYIGPTDCFKGFTPIYTQNMHKVYIFSPMNQMHNAQYGYFSDVEEIIQMGRLKEYVETSFGSKQIQKYLKKCSYQEVDHILNLCYEDLSQFIIHDYANYMFQELVHACSPDQRIKVISKIALEIPTLSQNKKGTHSLQTLVATITTSQEMYIICKSLEKDIIFLSENINSTYLIQKIILTFELVYLLDFFNKLETQFIRLCKSSHGICVLKCFIKKIQNNQQIVTRIVKNITENLDAVIQDPFGNYIVQYAYETYGQGKCIKITTEIIKNFTQYCIQKLAANVLDNCITNYCSNIHKDAIASIIQANSLEEMLKTSTGNSILLKLVKRSPNREIEEKIQKILSLPRMSKFSSNWDSHFWYGSKKAATCKNVHKETYNNFTQAVQMARNGQQKYDGFAPKIRKYSK